MNYYNGKKILGLVVNGGGGGSVEVDDELSTTSENPVQNKVILEALNKKIDIKKVPSGMHLYMETSDGTVLRQAVTQVTSDTTAFSGMFPMYRNIGTTKSSQLTTGTPGGDFSCANKKYVDDKFSVFSPLHHFVITPPSYDWTYSFYMVLPNQTEAFNTLAEFLDYIASLNPINRVIYFAGTSTEMNFNPSGFTQVEFAMDDVSVNIIGLKLDNNFIPKGEVESDTGATQFSFSDTVIG